MKKVLSRKLIYSPLLRMLLFKVWFRMVFFCLVLLGISLSLFLPKIWTTSPTGFMPVIKVSGLDLAQAWSLKRSARQAAAAGRLNDASYSWMAAIANNPADPESIRSFLNGVLRSEKPEPRYLSSAIGQSLWLLRLAQTNQTDLELAIKLYEKHRFSDLLLRVLSPLAGQLNSWQEAAYLKALFNQGRLKDFAERWDQGKRGPENDAELSLYRAAYLAGWGPGAEAGTARKRLSAALLDPELRVLANRLNLVVRAQLGDATGFGESLQRLEQWHADTLLDQVGYWRLLTAAGRKAEAIELAQAYPNVPASATETVRLAEIYVSLGLPDYAKQVLRRFASRFGHSPEVWMTYANIVIEARSWAELRAVATEIRRQDGVRDTLAGYSYYLEGRAELGEGRAPTAEIAFRKAGQHTYQIRSLGLIIAEDLTKLGYAAIARDILVPLEAHFKDSLEYWGAAFTTALELKDAPWVLKASTRTYELKPLDITYLNRYAAALLLNRTRPEEAVKLTLQLVSAYPNSLASVINHSMALLLNQRTREARTLLANINANRLTPAESASYYLALFEVFYNLHEYDQAWRMSDRIERQHLFPIQVKWLESLHKQMPARPGPAA
ncbi:MAG: hypothetical protein AAB466_14105 [Verrucomicrobiota bacterium]